MSASDRRRTVHEGQIHYEGAIANMTIMRDIPAASISAVRTWVSFIHLFSCVSISSIYDLSIATKYTFLR